MAETENKALWIFKNFKETIDELPKKDQGEAWRLVINYAFDGEESIEKDLTQTKKMVKMAFFSLKPLIKLRKKAGSQNGESNNPSGLSHDTEPNIGANIGANIDQNLGYTLYNNNNNNNSNNNINNNKQTETETERKNNSSASSDGVGLDIEKFRCSYEYKTWFKTYKLITNMGYPPARTQQDFEKIYDFLNIFDDENNLEYMLKCFFYYCKHVYYWSDGQKPSMVWIIGTTERLNKVYEEFLKHYRINKEGYERVLTCSAEE